MVLTALQTLQTKERANGAGTFKAEVDSEENRQEKVVAALEDYVRGGSGRQKTQYKPW